MRTSISDDNSYIEICKKAVNDDEYFKNFKRIKEYRYILEHTTYQVGQQYLNCIKQDNSHLLKDELLTKFKTNDLYGGSEPLSYEVGSISPSTLKYIKILSDLIKLYGDKLENSIIAEIGVGYGGQCKILKDYYHVNEYNLFDLLDVNMLAQKYLKKLNKTDIVSCQLEVDKQYDLVISCHAFSECSADIQKQYIDKVINKSRHGYLIINFINEAYNISYLSIEELTAMIKHDIFIIDENPQTNFSNNFKNNVLITW